MNRARPIRDSVGPIVLVLIYGLPLVWLLQTSLKSNTDIFRNPAGFIFTPTFDSYLALLDGTVAQPMLISFIIATSVAAGTLLIATPAAYALSRGSVRLVTVGVAVIVVMQMIPHTSMVIPLFPVLASWGLLGTVQGVIIANIGSLLPFAIIILTPFMNSVSRDIEEAAEVDGASRVQVFVRIVLPLVANGMITVAVLLFILGWGEFLFAINFLLDPQLYPLSALLAQQVGAYGVNWSGLMALAAVTALPIAVLSVVGQRWLRNGLSIGAVK